MKRSLILFLIPIWLGQLWSSEPTILYFVRHGQTDWNVQGKLQGHADIPLNNTGRAEATELRERICEIDFDICFSSDLQRAIETAQILTANCPVAIQSAPGLRERNFGPWEGRLFSELLEYEKEGQPFPDIETDEEIEKRISPFLAEIVSNHPGATILVVTHGGVIRSLLAHLLNIDSSAILSIQMKTMATLQLVISNGQYEIQEMTGIRIHADSRYGN